MAANDPFQTLALEAKYGAAAEGVMRVCSDEAWNNLVMNSEYTSYEQGSSKRAAAIASFYMSVANNGGLNHFLEVSYGLDAVEVLSALDAIGATRAARQFELVLKGMGISLPATTREEREASVVKFWGDELDEYDTLSKGADDDLIAALERHVAANEEFYRHLD